jgi:LysR family transcriptional regulator of gallate degradation
LDLRSVSRFLAVVESGSLNKAAQRLNLSQPALAKSIQLLERSLGAPLLDRTPRGVSLTSYGKSTYDHARRIASEVRRLEREIEAIRTLAYGEISIGVPLRQTSSHLAFAVLRLLGENRRVKMNIVTGARSGLVRLMLLGDVDFLFARLLEPGELTPDIRQIKLYLDPATLVVRAGHPILRRKTLAFADLAQYSWVVSNTARDADKALRELLGSEFSQSMLRSGSPVFVKNIICGSDFVGLVQRDAVRIDLAENSLVELRLSDSRRLALLFPPQEIGIIHRSDVSVSPVSAQLIAEMERLANSEDPKAKGLGCPAPSRSAKAKRKRTARTAMDVSPR